MPVPLTMNATKAKYIEHRENIDARTAVLVDLLKPKDFDEEARMEKLARLAMAAVLVSNVPDPEELIGPQTEGG